MSDNSSYQGNFLNNKKHGKGVYKLTDGTSFEGDWL